MRLRRYKYIFHLFPYIGVFIASLFRPYDADLGWHLKYGEYFFKNGKVLNDNIFSTQMTNFHWVNSSWGTDLISYAAFHVFGFLGLTVLAAFIITLTFFFFSSAFKLSFWEQSVVFPLIIYFEHPVNQVSFRGQLLSLMFLGALMLILAKASEKSKKYLLFLPPLFVLWANIHGEFLLGVGILISWVFFSMFISAVKSKRIFASMISQKWLLAVVVVSILATLIHPFGYKIYTESVNHFNNPLQIAVVEWNPLEVESYLWWQHIIVAMLVLIGGVLLTFESKLKSQLFQICMAVLLLVVAVSVRRYAWPAYYLSIPLLAPIALFFKPKVKRELIGVPIIISLLFISVATVDKLPLSQFSTMNWDKFCSEYLRCSPKATEYWAKHTNQKYLTYYNWGGYIIWNYPNAKPSIDGRMHLWKDELGFSAFEKYYEYEQNFKDINLSDYNQVLISAEKPIFARLMQLSKEGKWKLEYADSNASVFKRIKPSIITKDIQNK